ncbi:MAG: hypothetical protein E7C78_03350, partial [Dermabacter sp.]|nr:hypothetical protein [Dermabacter sp.]
VANSAGTGIGGAKQSYTYDAWGKQLTSTNQLGDVTTTTYDAKARVTSIDDGKGVTSFEYDGTDANGKAERRGLVTKQTVTRGAGTPLEYLAAYDATGALVTETLPAGITARHLLDEAGEEIGLSYSGQLTDPDTGEESVGEWIAWSQTNDVSGRVRTDTSTFASQIATTAGVTPEAEVTQAVDVNPLDFDHRYSYDKAGNLAKVEDLTKAPEGENTASPYAVRAYGFSAKGARTSLKETVHADGTQNGSATAGRTQAMSYDSADRPTGGYVYDLFGRQTTIPAVHAPHPDKGDITLAYFDSDLPHKITQGDTTTTFDLDVLARRLTQTTTTPSGVTTTTRHYADDTVTAIPITATTNTDTPAETINGWATYKEYGEPIDPLQAQKVAGPLGYGWRGDKERSTTEATASLTLMGVRLYNQTTGNFTSADPVPGGNATAYNYPTDPINQRDLSGRESRRAKLRRHAVTILTCASFGRRNCNKILFATAESLAVGKAYERNDNKANAIRHFVWMNLIYSRVSLKAAKAMGWAHEYGLAKNGTAKERQDSARDKANNRIALQWGRRHIRTMHILDSIGGLEAYLILSAEKLWRNRKFRTV